MTTTGMTQPKITTIAPPDTSKAQAIWALQNLLNSPDEKTRLEAAKALVEACRP